ncbi:hypothetical protein [Nocardia sp. alder85J]|uniref:hypothetical protein n=1 Tax=Nocardia sp. alder85J TaxID=2862949 RepID=UPI001CD2279B|nr:hypothetical protein [Nocardia sp. alder85J]MCX4098962.1 hypothetical protein [Nocardia sp. alder85J]
MSHSVIALLLLALAGFLFGGTWSLWKTTRPLAAALGVCGVLAAAGAITWMMQG